MVSQTKNLLNYPGTAPLWFKKVTVPPAQFEKKDLLPLSGFFLLLAIVASHFICQEPTCQWYSDISRKLKAKAPSSLLAKTSLKNHGSTTEMGQEFKVWWACGFGNRITSAWLCAYCAVAFQSSEETEVFAGLGSYANLPAGTGTTYPGLVGGFGLPGVNGCELHWVDFYLWCSIMLTLTDCSPLQVENMRFCQPK